MTRRALALLVGGVVAVAPVVASVCRLARGWLPAGDVAILAVRSHDVFSRHLPLVGMPSTASEGGTQVFHPGPLQMWVTGVATAVWDAAGTPLTVAVAVNLAAVLAAIWWSHRAWGDAGMALVALGFAAVGWSLRGELLASPFNPHAALLPFAAFLVALGARGGRATGPRGATVGAVLLGSWAAQAHLSFLAPVVAASLVALWSGRREILPALRAKPGRLVALTAVACWSGPVLDVLVNAGGNPRTLVERDGGGALGVGDALNVAVGSLVSPPVFAVPDATPLTMLARPALWEWVVGVALLGVTLWTAISRGSRPAGHLAGVGLAAWGAGLATLAFLPDTTLSTLALHNHLFAWPVAAVIWGVAAVSVGHAVGERRGARTPGWAAPALLLSGAVVALAGTTAAVRPTQDAERARTRAVAALATEHLDPDLTYLVEVDLAFEPFAIQTGVAAALERAGIAFTVPEAVGPGFGDHRTDGPADAVLRIEVDGTGPPPPSTAVIGEATYEREDGSAGQARVLVLPGPGSSAADSTVAP